MVKYWIRIFPGCFVTVSVILSEYSLLFIVLNSLYILLLEWRKVCYYKWAFRLNGDNIFNFPVKLANDICSLVSNNWFWVLSTCCLMFRFVMLWTCFFVVVMFLAAIHWLFIGSQLGNNRIYKIIIAECTHRTYFLCLKYFMQMWSLQIYQDVWDYSCFNWLHYHAFRSPHIFTFLSSLPPCTHNPSARPVLPRPLDTSIQLPGIAMKLVC